MKSRRTIPVVTAVLASTFAFQLSARTNAAQDSTVIVNFGDPGTLAGGANQVVDPDDATILKGGTVTFVVNGPGHGIAIYPVAKKTTREDITAQLCPHTPTCANPAFANDDHTTRDGHGDVVIVSGTNPPFQRIDDPTGRLLGTSTQIDGVAGPFLPGTAPGATPEAPPIPGTQLQFRFTKTGRYLVVCMNRGHYLNNWMFGFVNVVDD